MEEIPLRGIQLTEEGHAESIVYIRPKRKKIGTKDYDRVFPDIEIPIVRFPSTERKIIDLDSTSHGDIRILSYNVMAEGREKHPGFHFWGLRKQLLIMEILGYKPDIICLQEVLPEFYYFCEKKLKEFDFIGKYGFRDKCEKKDIWEATFYKRSRFEEIHKETFKYADHAKNLQNEAAKEYYNKPQIAFILELKFTDVDDTEKLVVVNTHLVRMSNPKHVLNNDEFKGNATLFQTKMLCNKLKSLYLDKHPSTTIIMCGDFNSGLSSEPYKFLDCGEGIDLENAYDSFKEWEKITEKQKKLFTVDQKWGATTILKRQTLWVDHIWHMGGLNCNGVLEIFPYHIKNKELWPSDHAAVMARFAVKRGYLSTRRMNQDSSTLQLRMKLIERAIVPVQVWMTKVIKKSAKFLFKFG